MKISRRGFFGIVFLGLVSLLFGRFFGLFRSRDKKVARYWTRGDHLAG